jgi:hypothetical protein
MVCTTCLVVNVSSVSGRCKKYWQLKWAHVFTRAACLVSPPTCLAGPRALFVSATTSREYLRGKYHRTIELLFDLFGLACFAIKNKNFSCHTADFKPVKQEVNGTVIPLPLVFPSTSNLVLLKWIFSN